MAHNNNRILSVEELNDVNSSLKIKYIDGKIGVVGVRRPNRVTLHDANKPFRINLKDFNYSVTITTTAIDIWLNINDEETTLFDVQNAINFLLNSQMFITKNSVNEILKKYYKKEK